MYFKRHVGMLNQIQHKCISSFFLLEFSTMYRTMELKNYLTVEEAISDLRTG